MQYCDENIKIINNPSANNDDCFVFCSSNGLMWNKTKDWVIENDYYEFKNVSNNKRISKAKKIIFLRDLETNFYVNGINGDVNNIEKIIERIKTETNGLKIKAVGYSAGGYLATILGLCLNNVQFVYSFGTVFNLMSWKGSHKETCFENNHSLVENSFIYQKRQFYNLLDLIKKLPSSHSTIFYCVYACKNDADIDVYNEASSCIKNQNFIFIPVKSEKHGVKPSYFDLVYLLSRKIKFKEKEKPYSKIRFSLKVQRLSFFLNKLLTMIYRSK